MSWGDPPFDPWHPRRERRPVDWFSFGVICVAFVVLFVIALWRG